MPQEPNHERKEEGAVALAEAAVPAGRQKGAQARVQKSLNVSIVRGA